MALQRWPALQLGLTAFESLRSWSVLQAAQREPNEVRSGRTPQRLGDESFPIKGNGHHGIEDRK